MTERWAVHTIVFDLDDTLYPERDYVFSGFDAVDAWVKARHGRDGFADRARALFDQGKRGRIFDEVLPSLGMKPSPVLVSGMLQAYRDHAPRLALFSDADDALKRFSQGFNLGLISDGYTGVQQRKIEALGLAARIPFRIITDEIGREFWKPSPEAFRRMMAHYGGAPEGFVYIADNPRKDFLGPKQLGWRTVRIRRQGGEHANYVASADESAEADVQSLAELTRLLGTLKKQS